MKIGIARADLADSMLPHKDSRLGVVKKVSGQMRNLHDDLRGDLGMSLRWNKDSQAGGSEKRRDKAPRLLRIPRLLQHARMGNNAQTHVTNQASGRRRRLSSQS